MRNTSQQYFYHPDHLGSSSFISDASGEVCQFLAYLPFGEQWVDQQSSSSYDAPYKFSGKELDAETGYNYFGARYYDSGLSVWLSVDPLAEKYPENSGYSFVANSPCTNVEIDGNWYVQVNRGRLRFIREDGDDYKSLVSFFGSTLNAQRYLSPTAWGIISQYKSEYIIGKYPVIDANPDHVITKAFKDGYNNPEKFFDITNPVERQKRGFRSYEDYDRLSNYNCYHFVLQVLVNKPITDEMTTASSFDAILKSKFNEVSVSDAVFGRTIMAGNFSGGVAQHVGLFGGTDRNGDSYIIEKPNGYAAPTVRKLTAEELENYRFYNKSD